jgi:hypothetical protein
MNIKIISFFICLIICFSVMGCMPGNMKNIPATVSYPAVVDSPTEVYPSYRFLNRTPISVVELPGSPEEISKVCQLDEYQDYYCSNRQGGSPDGEWSFYECLLIHDCETHSHYVMYNQVDPGQSWVVKNQEIISRPEMDPRGSWYVSSWNLDQASIFFVYRDFCEHWWPCMYSTADAVFKMNFNDRSMSEVIPDRDDANDYALDFSHNSRYLAYIINKSHTLYLRDLETGLEDRILLDKGQIAYGKLSWSPDDQYIVFRGSSRENFLDYSLWLLSVNGLPVIRLLPDDERDLTPAGWINNSTIRLYDEGSGDFVPLIYNIITGDIWTEIIPTSTP